MKPIILFLALTMAVFADAPKIDASILIGAEAHAAVKAWGEPYLKSSESKSANWTVGDFDVTVKTKDGIIIGISVIPDGKVNIPGKEPHDAASFLSLTKDNGWEATEVLKVGVRNEVMMKHSTKGAYLLVSSKVGADEGFSVVSISKP